MNTVCLIGNLTRDPELRDAGENKVASLRIAVSGRRKQGEEWVDVPNFFDVTVWGRQAELAAEHLEKGRQIAVTGRLQSSEYESAKFSDSDGQPAKQSRVDIVATDIQYLAKPQQRNENIADDLRSDPSGELAAANVTGDDIPY